MSGYLVGRSSTGRDNTASVTDDGALKVDALEGLDIPAHDYISLSYTGSNLTGVIYKSGGSGGVTVAALTLVYDGSNNLISVAKS
jgi:hypothetical protein